MKVSKKVISKIKKWIVDVKLRYADKKKIPYLKETHIIGFVRYVKIKGNNTSLVLDVAYSGKEADKDRQNYEFRGKGNFRYGDLITLSDSLMDINSFNVENGDLIGTFNTDFSEGGCCGTDWSEINRLLDKQN